MKIRSIEGQSKILDVYAIYWVNGIRYHLVIPYRDYKGLLVIPSSKCEVVSASIDGFILRKSSMDGDILVHWSVSDGDLLDRLIDPPDEEAMLELEQRLKSGSPPKSDQPIL